MNEFWDYWINSCKQPKSDCIVRLDICMTKISGGGIDISDRKCYVTDVPCNEVKKFFKDHKLTFPCDLV
jgi:hypothetical protein